MQYGFIVEGFNDESKLLQVIPNAHVVVTKGTRLNNRVRMDINLALNKCSRVYLLSDPDVSGDLIANSLLTEFPMLTRILLDADQCKCYRRNKIKVGVEHTSNSYLYSVLRTYL
jgi:ribonuclease M5